MGPHMVLSSSLDSDFTVAPGDITGHTDWHVPSGTVALRHQTAPGSDPAPGPWQQESQTSMQTLAAVRTQSQA